MGADAVQIPQEPDALAEIASLRRRLADDPADDATDLAHPAWWRGYGHGFAMLVQKIDQILDGRDIADAVASEPWQSTRVRLVSLVRKLAESEQKRETLEWAVGVKDRQILEHVDALNAFTERNADLQRRLAEAEARERTLRDVCGEAYQLAGVLGASEEALDNLSAAASGEPIPHKTFLPATPTSQRSAPEPSIESRVAEWVRTRIGEAHLHSRERAMRLLEEAMELAQAEGISPELVAQQTAHVYARPAGEPSQEAAGVAVCLFGWCASRQYRLIDLAMREIERIEAKPVEQIRGSVARKADADLVTCMAEPEPSDTGLLNWLQEEVVDTIYLDDGRIIDVAGNSVRAAIRDAMKAPLRDSAPEVPGER